MGGLVRATAPSKGGRPRSLYFSGETRNLNIFTALLRLWLTMMNCTFFFFFLGLYPRHMEVPRLGAKSELKLQAYITAIAMQDPSRIFNLHHSSGQCRIHNSLSQARDQTCNLMVPGWIHFCCTTTGTPAHF